jgi:hypothetical protein
MDAEEAAIRVVGVFVDAEDAAIRGSVPKLFMGRVLYSFQV